MSKKQSKGYFGKSHCGPNLDLKVIPRSKRLVTSPDLAKIIEPIHNNIDASINPMAQPIDEKSLLERLNEPEKIQSTT